MKVKKRENEVDEDRLPPLTPEEKRGQDLLGFDDLRLFGIRYSRAHLYRLIKAGKFPRPVRLGEARVAFVREQIIAHVDGIKQGTPV